MSCLIYLKANEPRLFAIVDNCALDEQDAPRATAGSP